MEKNNEIKIINAFNLPTINTKNQITIAMDANTRIKQVLDIEACLIDWQAEPSVGKIIIKGSVGIKLIYMDSDNIYSTVSENVTFNESVTNDLINSNCNVDICSSQFVAEYESNEQSINISINGSIDCLCVLNGILNTFNALDENVVAKKTILNTQQYIDKVKNSSTYSSNFCIDEKINKMLCFDSKIALDEIKCCNGYIVVSGNIYNTLMYEINNDICSIKTYRNSIPFKYEIECPNADNDCIADLYAYVNLNNTQITTDINENNSQLSFEYCIETIGNVFKYTNVDIIDDLYSLNNSLEVSKALISTCKKLPYLKACDGVDTEITLADELNIDEIVGIVNTVAIISQTNTKNNFIVVEGVISGNLIYLDENKDTKYLPIQLPYSLNTKHECDEELCAINLHATITNCKGKIRRGNTLIIDCEVCVSGTVYAKTETHLIDDIKLGNPISYDDIAFQVYVAHNNESCWDLCKRLHITQEKLMEYNKENPATYKGGEKVIVYR